MRKVTMRFFWISMLAPLALGFAAGVLFYAVLAGFYWGQKFIKEEAILW